MPYDNVPESKWEEMDRCKDKVMGQGHDEKSAIAICYSSIVEGKSLDVAIKEYQVGKAFQDMRAKYGEEIIYFGDTVKALGDGRLGGYLVRYGDPATLDLTGDFFTPQTDFDSSAPGRTRSGSVS